MVIKYLFTLGLTVLSGGLLLAFLMNPLSSQKLPFQGSKLASKLVSERKEAHDQCLAKIKTEFAICDEEWNASLDYVAELAKNDDLLGSQKQDKSLIPVSDHWLIQEVKKILINYGINLNRIILQLDDSPTSNGEARQWYDEDSSQIKHLLILNPAFFAQLSPDEREAALRHEVMHLINYDPLEQAYLMGLLEQLGHDDQAVNASPAVIGYRHDLETRADLLSVLEKPHLAYANKERFDNLMRQYEGCDETIWRTHPSFQDRARTMENLIVAFTDNPVQSA